MLLIIKNHYLFFSCFSHFLCLFKSLLFSLKEWFNKFLSSRRETKLHIASKRWRIKYRPPYWQTLPESLVLHNLAHHTPKCYQKQNLPLPAFRHIIFHLLQYKLRNTELAVREDDIVQEKMVYITCQTSIPTYLIGFST